MAVVRVVVRNEGNAGTPKTFTLATCEYLFGYAITVEKAEPTPTAIMARRQR